MKTIPVKNCKKCPFLLQSDNKYECGYLKKPLSLQEYNIIPDWCELPDSDPRSSEYPRFFKRILFNNKTNQNESVLFCAFAEVNNKMFNEKFNIEGLYFIFKDGETNVFTNYMITGIEWGNWVEISKDEFWKIYKNKSYRDE
jgi:hypothetical protein